MTPGKLKREGARRLGAVLLFAALLAIAGSLVGGKRLAVARAEAAAGEQPESAEVVEEAIAEVVEHRATTTAIGTVVALRSITLRNEMPGTVHAVRLNPGEIVEAGTVLVRLDTTLEAAELRALRAQSDLAASTLERVQRMFDGRAASAIELDNARARLDVAEAEIARTEAVIARKVIRAPFRARVGIADVHVGQYLDGGTTLTTLQSVDPAVHIDFPVVQAVAESLGPGVEITIHPADGTSEGLAGRVVAADSRVDPATRNARIRARVEGGAVPLVPGASVRVLVPVGAERPVVVVPVNALRRGPGGDHVFVIIPDDAGLTRASMRPVEAGPVLEDRVTILSGLAAGERVATAGSFKLRQDALVHVAAAADDQTPAGR